MLVIYIIESIFIIYIEFEFNMIGSKLFFKMVKREEKGYEGLTDVRYKLNIEL